MAGADAANGLAGDPFAAALLSLSGALSGKGCVYGRHPSTRGNSRDRLSDVIAVHGDQIRVGWGGPK